jgi:hypothetical protein
MIKVARVGRYSTVGIVLRDEELSRKCVFAIAVAGILLETRYPG